MPRGDGVPFPPRPTTALAYPSAVSGRPTLRDVAAAAGVSRSTVSNAYNRPDQLSARLREQVLATAERLGYPGPSPTGSALRRGRTGALGVLLGERLGYAFRDPAAAGFLDGLAEAVETERFGLLVLPGPTRGGGTDPETVRAAVVDAMVAYSLPDDAPALLTAMELGLPVVTVDQPTHPGVPGVGIDDESGARAAAEHLLALGHRRLAVVAFELSPDQVAGPADLARQERAAFSVSRRRLAGYRAAVEAAGLDWSAVAVWECRHNSARDGATAATALLTPAPGAPGAPTAVLAMSDELALGVRAAAGSVPPEQLSVVGFDDTDAAAHAGLTTVHQPLREKGQRAGELVLAALAGEPAPSVLLPTRLVVRASTAAARPP